MKKWAFIYTLGDATASVKWEEIGSEACRLVSIGVPDIAKGVEIAPSLPGEGIELIELCGAFCGRGLAEVIDAVDGKVPVGAVFYGCEAATGLHKLFGE